MYLHSEANSCNFSIRRAHATTFKPLDAKVLAKAAPRPAEAPVTKATLPLHCSILSKMKYFGYQILLLSAVGCTGKTAHCICAAPSKSCLAACKYALNHPNPVFTKKEHSFSNRLLKKWLSLIIFSKVTQNGWWFWLQVRLDLILTNVFSNRFEF